jgi:hypothetical protein
MTEGFGTRNEFTIDTPRFEPLSAEEAEATRGGIGPKAGVCLAIGFACANQGGIKVGLCLLIGVCTDNGLHIFGSVPEVPPPPPPPPPPAPPSETGS